jgi:hypothetical protein
VSEVEKGQRPSTSGKTPNKKTSTNAGSKQIREGHSSIFSSGNPYSGMTGKKDAGAIG